jgi:hypothetical protein
MTLARPALLVVTAVLLSIPLGIVGGAVCGAAILSFGDLIGRSGDTGTGYIGYWNVASVWLGLLYGGLLGAVVTPIAYLALVRKIGFRKAVLPATIGTLLGGFVGAVVGPPLAVLTGVLGFFVTIRWAVQNTSRSEHSVGPYRD